MDPNLFHIDWERTFEALVGIIVLSFLVERALALVFESRWWIRLMDDPRVGQENANSPPRTGDASSDDDPATKKKTAKKPAQPIIPPRSKGRLYPFKEILAFGLAALICWIWNFDAVSIILLRDQTTRLGELVTAAVIAGGSKASIGLFRDLMRIRSDAETERRKLKAQDRLAGAGQ